MISHQGLRYFTKINTLLVMVGYIKFVYDQALIHFGDKSSKGAYEEVIPTSSQILPKLDLERLILVLRTRLIHITSRIHQN